MVNKKVTPTMVEKWQSEINRRIYHEFKTNIIKDIANREGLSHETVNYWIMPERYREKRRQNVRNYQKEHIEECQKMGREYAEKNRKKQKEYQRVRYSDPEINVRIRIQKYLHWRVEHNIEQLLPEIISRSNTPVSIEEMVNILQHITGGITVRYSTLEKSIENYLMHNHHPLIKKVEVGKYTKI